MRVLSVVWTLMFYATIKENQKQENCTINYIIIINTEVDNEVSLLTHFEQTRANLIITIGFKSNFQVGR